MKFRPALLLRAAVPAALVASSLVVLTSSSGSAAEDRTPFEPKFTNRHKPAGKAAYEPNAVIVKFKPTASVTKRKAVLSKFRTTTEDSVSDTTVKITGSVPAPELLKKVKADPTVELASLNYIRRATAVPNDLYYPMYAGGVWGQADAMNTIRMPQAWDLSKTNGSQLVAVLDTGVDVTQPDLVGHLVQGFNAVSSTRPTKPYDDHGHGTMTLGIIASAANNGKGTAGVTWNGKAMPVKVLNNHGEGPDSQIIKGLDWAVAHGAKVVNMSFGSDEEEGTLLHDAIKRAVAKGVVIVASAGNDGDGRLHYPASYSEVIAVGATDNGGSLTSFSSYGDWVDIAAPGRRILTTGVVAMTDPQDDPVWSCTGTSCSTPLVAGVAAMVKNKWPSYTPAQVAARLKSTARDAGPRGLDPYYGAGILDAYGALGGKWGADFATNPADGNDQPARAVEITGTPVQGTSRTEGDVDWYKVGAASAARNIKLSLTGPIFNEATQTSNFAPRVDVYDSELRRLGGAVTPYPTRTDPNGNPIWEQLNATALVSAPAGVAYIAVRNDNGSRDSRSYSLDVTTEGNGGTASGIAYPVSDALPADLSVGAAVTTKPSVTFARAIDAATVTAATVRLVNGKTGAVVATTPAYTEDTRTVVLTPSAPLLDNAPYQIQVSGVQETGGTALAPFRSVFSTVDLVPAALETFDASGSFQKANLGWKIPALGDLDQIIVRRNAGGRYPTPTTGTLVYSGTASSFANTALPQSTTYTYSAWVKDRSGKLSAGKGTQLLGMKSGISTTSTKLNIGGSITLKGSTLGIDGKAYPTLPMSIYSRPANGTTFKLLKTLGSSSTGTVSYTFKPGYSAVYMLTFAGNGDLMGTRTNDITVLVTPTISSTLSPSTVKLGSTTKLSGVVTPAHSGKSVQLQRLVGKTWTAAASVKLSSSGAYAFGIKPPYKGKIAYRVYFPSDGDHTLAYSAIRTLTIT
ncbi:S8 family serine peptidase [Kribbella albertanoniae]|uniref:S8 family serine peptidase n=1 Tax=Kribbella albertanoniae TaxID=1266829 RepID=UPI001EE0E6A1|nr:S8 family serine peptidase [Kribbella albertanoniae]